jgi:hypothetical protein
VWTCTVKNIFLSIIIFEVNLLSIYCHKGLPNGSHEGRTGHNPPLEPSGDWWLTSANAVETNGLTCLPEQLINFWSPIRCPTNIT